MKKKLLKYCIFLTTYPIKFFEFCIELYLISIHGLMHLIVHRRLPSVKSGRFNDILFRIKTHREYYSDPKRVFVTDKILAKIYIAAKVGEKYTIPTLLEISDSDELTQLIGTNFGQKVVIKPSHSCGKTLIRQKIDIQDKSILSSWLDECYFDQSLEYYYRSLKPQIIVEPLVFGTQSPNDFKFFCKDGKVMMIQVDIDRHSNHVRALYRPNWTKHDFSIGYPFNPADVDVPDNLTEMINVAEKLSDGFDYIRIDLYSNNKEVKVGELTNCHGNALERIISKKLASPSDELKFFEG